MCFDMSSLVKPEKCIASECIVIVDGACSGNPGPAAVSAAFISGEQFKVYTTKLDGTQTNNKAEFMSVIYALRKIATLGDPKRVFTIYTDSKLVVDAMNGYNQLKNPALVELASAVRVFSKGVRVSFKHTSEFPPEFQRNGSTIHAAVDGAAKKAARMTRSQQKVGSN